MTRTSFPYVLTGLILVFTAGVLLYMGRVPICACGYVKLWHGETMSSENSQHLMDWYTPSHVLHGLIFYAALWLVAGKVSLGWRFAIANVVECVWEIIEHGDAVIERYRAVTISLDYYGDSVINSVADILAMWAGFGLARVLPVWASVALVIVAEVGVGYVIRDGLALNVLMLLYPIEAVMEWQAGS